MISIAECLQIMHSGAEFSLKVVQFDRRRKEKQGRILEVPCAVLVWGDGGNDRVKMAGERPLTDLERILSGGSGTMKKDPSHEHHYTRNIRVIVDGLQTEVIYKIHPPLIIEFNGQTTTA